MKQKFKGKNYTTTKVVNNILKIYNQSKNINEDWYTDANMFAQELAYKYIFREGRKENFKQSLTKVCGVIAALSPLKTWSENKLIAESFLSGGKGKHTKMFIKKATDIMYSDGSVLAISEILNGNKITSFFLNIYDPKKSIAVTIDRHAVSIAVGESITGDKLQMSTKQYEFFVNCYRVAAAKVNTRPSTIQAITWVRWRELKSYDSMPINP